MKILKRISPADQVVKILLLPLQQHLRAFSPRPQLPWLPPPPTTNQICSRPPPIKSTYFQSPVQSAPWLEQLQFQGQHTSAIKRRNQISNLCEPLAMQLFEEEENQTHRKLELGRFKWRGNWPLGWGWHPLDGDTRSNQPEIYLVAICKVMSSKPWWRVARRGQPSPWECWSARPEKFFLWKANWNVD